MRANPLRMRTRITIPTLVACACLAGLVFVGLNHPIQNNNEGLYASVARSMLDGGSWIVPHLDGVPYVEKPPLLYWITALAYAVFGEREAASRVAPVLGSLLTLSAVYWLAARNISRRAALVAVFVLASCPLIVGLTRMLMFDLLFTGLYAWALFLMHEALLAPRPLPWIRGAYVLLALAVLTKGWVALALFGLIAIAMVALGGRAGAIDRAKRIADPLGIALFLAISLPWHLYAWSQEPGFGWFYLWNEHVLRFLDQREPRDYYHGPFWYYLPRVLGAALPWALVLAVPARSDPGERFARGFLWACFLVPLAFFSASAAKANYYMVVGLPPLAIIVARRLLALRNTRLLALLPLAWAGAMIAAWMAASRLGMEGSRPSAPLAAAIALALASAAFFASHKFLRGVVACAAMALPLAWFASAYLAMNSEATSERRVAGFLHQRGIADLYVYRDFEAISSIAWYWNAPVGVIDSASNELRYGLSQVHDESLFPSTTTFVAERHAQPAAVLVLEKRRAALEASPLGARLVRLARFGNVSVYEWRPRGTIRTVER